MHSQRRKLFAGVGMVATALLFVILTSWPARAAIELLYFRASASTNTVLLEWATAQETNISGFIIECKRVDEPDAAYHAIGARDAVGSPQQGSTYSFNVASGLEPGVTYCFRLVERTIDGLPGEQFELCGYGAAITPTPATTSEFAGLGDGTPGAIIVVPPPVAPDTEPAFTPTLPLPDAPEIPTPTPTPTGPISPQAIPPAPDSPLPPPDEEPDADAAGELAPMPAPTLTPTFTPTATPTQPDSPPPFPTDTPMPEEEEAFLPGLAGDPAEVEAADATPTPLYFVVTATPTAEAVAVAPTFTPWPTVTPQPEFSLVEMLSPSAQNLMVMLLCLIFLTASGLGTLGLVTSVIYMRSRAQREEYINRLYGRRRY